jgi:hypothetical protein
VERYRNPQGRLNEILFLPLFNTNFIWKFEINAWKGMRHFSLRVDSRFFHHWFSRVKTPSVFLFCILLTQLTCFKSASMTIIWCLQLLNFLLKSVLPLYGVLTLLNQWSKNLWSSRGLKCLVPFPALISNFEIKLVLNNGRNKFSFRCPCGLRYFSTLES